MESQNKILLLVAAVVTLAVLVLLFQPAVKEQLAPEPVTAWVAIEVVDRGGAYRGVAEVAPADLEVGTTFRLHAVLEARGRGDRAIYYTEAPALRIAGEDVPASSLRSWDRPRPVRIRWFTLEGRRPYIELDPESGIKGFEFQAFLRSDWPVSWSIPGEIDAAHDNHLETGSALEEQIFGTQRYHVRIELYGKEDDLVPRRIIRSWGIEDLRSQREHFPTVRLTLPGTAAPASRVFGLSQLEPPASSGSELLEQIAELARYDIAFSRLTVLRDQIRQAGLRAEDLEWRDVDLQEEVSWEGAGRLAAGPRPGDLMRVGDRVVVLYEDRGAPGRLDHGDLCFDFVQGASVRTLGEVFGRGDEDGSDENRGEVEGQVVELAYLGR